MLLGDFIYKPLIKSLTEKVERMFNEPLTNEFQEGRFSWKYSQL